MAKSKSTRTSREDRLYGVRDEIGKARAVVEVLAESTGSRTFLEQLEDGAIQTTLWIVRDLLVAADEQAQAVIDSAGREVAHA